MSTASLLAAQQQFAAQLPAVEDAARWAFGPTAQAPGLRGGAGRGLRRRLERLGRLALRGKDPVQVGVHGIANQAVRYVLHGRRVANRSCGRGAMDVYHRKAQKARGFRVINADSLEGTDDPTDRGVWGNCCTPADEACFRVDYSDWLAALVPRRRRIAELLAASHGTLEVARAIGVTPAAISLARSWLSESWRRFQGEPSGGRG